MRYITLAIAFLIGTNAQAQIIRAEPFYTAPEEAGVTNLLLDNYPGAAVAYSLRKLDKDYTGSAIRVRRSNDNAEQDIGFVNNYLDTASMKTFVGANNGFVVTWYNQADSSGVFGLRNATQSTAANQPRIINSGAIYYRNGEVSAEFDGTNDAFLITINANLFPTNASVFTLSSFDDQNREDVVYDFNRTTSYQIQQVVNAVGDSIRSYSRRITAIQPFSNYGNQVIFYQGLTASNLSIALNNNALTTVSYTAGTTSSGTDHAIGANRINLAGNNIKGAIYELIFYPSDQSSNRTAIRDNINSFYSIY